MKRRYFAGTSAFYRSNKPKKGPFIRNHMIGRARRKGKFKPTRYT